MIDSIAPIGERLPAINASASTTASPFSKALDGLENQMQTNDQNIVAFAAGSEKIPLHEIMVNMEHTRLKFQFALQVRNKLQEALQELYRSGV